MFGGLCDYDKLTSLICAYECYDSSNSDWRSVTTDQLWVSDDVVDVSLYNLIVWILV